MPKYPIQAHILRGLGAGALSIEMKEASVGSVIRNPKLELEIMFTKSAMTLVCHSLLH